MFSNILSFIQNNQKITFVTLLFLYCIILFSGFIFGDISYLFIDIGGDTIMGYYPKYVGISEVTGDYTFTKGIGADSPSLVKNPFCIFYKIFGTTSISTLVAYVAILKIVLAGFFTFLWLRSLRITTFPASIGGMLYAFNGFIILWGQHDFATVAVFVPLLLYSIELWIKSGKWLLFSFALFLSAVNLYTFFPLSILLLLYFFTRIAIEKKIDLVFIGKTALIAVFSVLLASHWLFNDIISILDSGRVTASGKSDGSGIPFIWNKQYYLALISRIFSNNALGGALSWKGMGNYYSAPMLYLGILPFLFIPQFFVGNASMRKKKIYGGILSLAILLLLFPVFAYFFNAFQTPQTRWTYIVIVFILIITIEGIKTVLENSINKKVLFISAASLVLLFGTYILLGATSTKVDSSVLTTQTIRFVIALSAYILLLIIVLSKDTKLFKFLFLFCLLAEVGIEHYPTLYQRRHIEKGFESQNKYYSDNTLPAVDYLQKNDSSFYRLIKNYKSIGTGLNDSKAQLFNGVISYSSTNNKDYLKYLKVNGVKNITHRYIRPFNNRADLLTLLNVKYGLSNNGLSPASGFKKIKEIDGISLFKNTSHLPLGYTYDTWVTDSTFEKSAEINKTNLLISNAIIKSDNIQAFDSISTYTLSKKKILKNVAVTDILYKNFNKKKSGKAISLKAETPKPFIRAILKDKIKNNKAKISFVLKSSKEGSISVHYKNGKGDYVDKYTQKLKIKKGEHSYVLTKKVSDIKSLRVNFYEAKNTQFELKDFNIQKTVLRQNLKSKKAKQSKIAVKEIGVLKGKTKKKTKQYISFSPKVSAPSLIYNLNAQSKKARNLIAEFSFNTKREMKAIVYFSDEKGKYNRDNSHRINIKKGKSKVIVSNIAESVKNIRINFIGARGIVNVKQKIVSEPLVNIYKNELAILKEDTLNITNWSHDSFEGSISLPSNKILQLSIPYSKKWNLYVNGEKTKFYKTNYCFIGIPLTKGEYNITLEYSDFNAFSIISIIAFIIFSAFLILRIWGSIKARQNI